MIPPSHLRGLDSRPALPIIIPQYPDLLISVDHFGESLVRGLVSGHVFHLDTDVSTKLEVDSLSDVFAFNLSKPELGIEDSTPPEVAVVGKFEELQLHLVEGGRVVIK